MSVQDLIKYEEISQPSNTPRVDRNISRIQESAKQELSQNYEDDFEEVPKETPFQKYTETTLEEPVSQQ